MNTPPIITIFGGTGFVGSHIVADAIAKGWQVRIATRSTTAAQRTRISGYVGQVTSIVVDYDDEESLRAAVAGADYIVYSIGLLFEKKGRGFDQAHIEYPARIARLAKEENAASFVLISALGCDTGLSRYAKTKLQGEAAVKAAFPEASIVRPSLVFGQDGGFFVKFADLASLLPALPLIGGGKTLFQPVYVGDVVSAVMTCLSESAHKGKIFELGGPQVYSFKALFQMILSGIKRSIPLVPLPFWIAEIEGHVFSVMPEPLLTADQVVSLKTDNTVSAFALTFTDLGITPTSCEAIVPQSLRRFARKES